MSIFRQPGTRIAHPMKARPAINLLSILLAVALVISLVPIGVFLPIERAYADEYLEGQSPPAEELDAAGWIAELEDPVELYEPAVVEASEAGEELEEALEFNQTTDLDEPEAVVFTVDFIAPEFMLDPALKSQEVAENEQAVEPWESGFIPLNFLGWEPTEQTLGDIGLSSLLGGSVTLETPVTSDQTLYGWFTPGALMEPMATLEALAFGDEDFTINFPGVSGVTVRYSTSVSGWQTVGIFDDICEFSIPLSHQSSFGNTTIQLTKGGMSYSFVFPYDSDDLPCEWDIPVVPLTVTGIEAACNLAVVQSNWVYNSAAAAVGVDNVFNVFKNTSGVYEVQLTKSGFYTISTTVAVDDTGGVVDFSNCFYEVTVPAGFSTVRMQSSNWIINPASAGDTITLLADHYRALGFRDATVSFVFGGNSYSGTFPLDGATNPFAALLPLVTIDFPGFDDVTVNYYNGTGWHSAGTGFTDSVTFVPEGPNPITQIDVTKGGMTYSFFLDDTQQPELGKPLSLTVPTIELQVIGIWADDCTLGVAQDDYIYNHVPGVVSGVTSFSVFDNGSDYYVHLFKPGFNSIVRTAVAGAGILYVYLADNVFYQIEVPAGVTKVQMQSNSWIQPYNAKAGDKIDAIKDTGNEQDASMTFVYEGETYSLNFKLDGTNPFDLFKKVVYDEGASGTITGMPVDKKLYLAGDEVEVSADVPLRDGYIFDGWLCDLDSGTYWAGDRIVVPDPAVDITFTAQWQKDSYGFTVAFPGVEGVSVRYVTDVAGYVDIGVFDDGCTFAIPDAEIGTLATSFVTVQAIKNGMTYSFSTVVGADELFVLADDNLLEVPVIPLVVSGIETDCSIHVGGQGWVYPDTPVTAGNDLAVPAVFNNGRPYNAQLSKPGFHPILSEDAVLSPMGDELWIEFRSDIFYDVTVPGGITNLNMASYSGVNWIVTGAEAGDVIDLLADWYGYDRGDGFRTANMTFDYDGNSYSIDFVLDGTDPFAGMSIVNFPGVEGVTVQYYASGVWTTLPGIFDNTTGIINIPTSATSVRAVKAGMYYQFDGVTWGSFINVFDVPVITLRVLGIATDCNIGIWQGNWVYPAKPATGGVQLLYNVFDNGRPYTAQLSKTGFYIINSPAATRETYLGEEELWIYFDDSIFYVVTVPDGITDVRMQSNNWIYPMPAQPGDDFTLLRDVYRNLAGDGWRSAKMSFVWKGVNYSVEFWLNGMDPFDIIRTVTYDGNGGLDGLGIASYDSSYLCINDDPYFSSSFFEEPVVAEDNSFILSGYSFLGWNTADDGTGDWYDEGDSIDMVDIPPTGLVLYAQWKLITYTVIFDPGAQGSWTAGSETYIDLLPGDPTPSINCTPNTDHEPGWEFVDWTPMPAATVTGDAIYVAQWSQVSHTVSFVDWDGTPLKLESVLYGGSATAPAPDPVRSGYTFAGWDVLFNNITGDLTVTAIYNLIGTPLTNPPVVPLVVAVPPDAADETVDETEPVRTDPIAVSPTNTQTATTATSTPVITIADQETPLVLIAKWSLVNLILAAVGILMALLTLIMFFKKRTKESDNAQTGKKNVSWPVLSLILGAVAVIIFLLTQDMRLPMGLIDWWTIAHAIIFIAQIALTSVVFRKAPVDRTIDGYAYGSSSL